MQVDRETIRLVTNVMNRDGGIDLPADGTSMFPFIRKGDICRFGLCEASLLNKGDIVLYRTSFGQLVAHRFYEAKQFGNRKMFIFKGDTNLRFDDPVGQEQLIGKLVYIRRSALQIDVSNIIANVWSKLILSFPVLSHILRMYIDRKGSTRT